MNDTRASVALLILRIVGGGLMLVLHGWPKLSGFAEKSGGFADPIGLGPTLSLGLTVFAEFFCALLVVIGMWTRWAAIPLVITMLVAALIVHGGDPLGKKEMALLFASIFGTLALTGGGRYALELSIRRGQG